MTDRPTVFLLPGLLCDEAVWSAQREALAPYADVRVPVFRGFNSLESMARAVLEDAPERFSVAGHSMGGRVAMELVHMAGNRIDKFSVMDTGVRPVQPGEPEKRQALVDLAEREGIAAVAAEWLPPMIHPDRRDDSELVRSITDMILRNGVDDFKGQIQALLSRNDQRQYLSGITQHVLLVCGEADEWSPVSQHEEMLHMIRDAELEIIGGAGHMVTMEKSDEISQLLVDWLKGR